MAGKIEFKDWLASQGYTDNVVGDIQSRLKRVNGILPFDGTNLDEYLFRLGQQESFKGLSMSVRSQLRKSAKLYAAYVNRK